MKKIHEFEPLQPGILLRRYKRFLVDIRLEDGQTVTAYTSNSGAMRTCSDPGSAVMLSFESKAGRKTEFTLEMVRSNDIWIGVNTMLANMLGEKIIQSGLTGLPELEGFNVVKREVVLEDSRLDILAQNEGRSCYIEVKNVTYREKDTALFPDAVTARGKKHLETLTRRSRRGGLACNLFLIQRSDCSSFSTAVDIDHAYAEALRRAVESGVLIVPCLLHIEPEAVFFMKTLPLA